MKREYANRSVSQFGRISRVQADTTVKAQISCIALWLRWLLAPVSLPFILYQFELTESGEKFVCNFVRFDVINENSVNFMTNTH